MCTGRKQYEKANTHKKYTELQNTRIHRILFSISEMLLKFIIVYLFHVGEWGTGDWAVPLFSLFVFYIHRSKSAHFISQAYHWNAPTVDDVTSTLSYLWPLFPRAPCLPKDFSVFPSTSVSPPCCIGSLFRGFVLKSKPANAREQRYFVDLEGLFVCHHQQKRRFC